MFYKTLILCGIMGYCMLFDLPSIASQDRAIPNGPFNLAGSFHYPTSHSTDAFYDQDRQASLTEFLTFPTFFQRITGLQQGNFILQGNTPETVFPHARVSGDLVFGLQLGYQIDSRLELAPGISYSRGTVESEFSVRTDVPESNTGTASATYPGMLSGVWQRWTARLNSTYFVNEDRLQVGLMGGIGFGFNSSIKETVSLAGQAFDFKSPHLGTDFGVGLAPVLHFRISDRFFVRGQLTATLNLSSDDLPHSQTSVGIICGYAFVYSNDRKIPDINLLDVGDEEQEDEEEEPLSDKAARLQAEARRVREAMEQGQARRLEELKREREGNRDQEEQDEFPVDPETGLEPTAGRLQEQFFHAVKMLPNVDSLMREFRKLSAEDGQKVVDALYAASRASSARYWAEVARHNREYEAEYDSLRAKFREEFAREWGALQWQFLEPILDPAATAVDLAAEAGVIDKTTAEAIKWGTALASPAAGIMRGIKRGTKKLIQGTAGTARRQVDDTARSARRATDQVPAPRPRGRGGVARTTVRYSDDVVRGSIRTISRTGISAPHARQFLKMAKNKNWTIVVRKGNPQSLPHHCRPNFISKPVSCKAKTAKWGPDAGVVVDPSHPKQVQHYLDALDEARKKGDINQVRALQKDYDESLRTWNKWMADNQGKIHPDYRVDAATGQVFTGRNRMHGDYDLHGVFGHRADGTPSRLNFGSGNVPGEGISYQEYMNRQLGKRQCRHGAQENWAKNGVVAEADPPVVVFTPDGKIVELETVDAMREFYRDNRLPIPESWGSG